MKVGIAVEYSLAVRLKVGLSIERVKGTPVLNLVKYDAKNYALGTGMYRSTFSTSARSWGDWSAARRRRLLPPVAFGKEVGWTPELGWTT
jgi:hypothetical protein